LEKKKNNHVLQYRDLNPGIFFCKKNCEYLFCVVKYKKIKQATNFTEANPGWQNVKKGK